uniref:Uncharacterized protein n=1 Tax=Anguilla anguilla TaxID=7936 RepID=A0A0E9VZX1_ANGAN
MKKMALAVKREKINSQKDALSKIKHDKEH